MRTWRTLRINLFGVDFGSDDPISDLCVARRRGVEGVLPNSNGEQMERRSASRSGPTPQGHRNFRAFLFQPGRCGSQTRAPFRFRQHALEEVFHFFVALDEAKAGLEDFAAGQFVDSGVTNGGDLVPIGTSTYIRKANGASAPGGEDDFGVVFANLPREDDAIGGGAAGAQVRKDVLAAGALDQFADPGDAGDERVVPLFEIDARADFHFGYGSESPSKFGEASFAFQLRTNDAREQRESGFNFGEGALVGGEHAEAALHEFAGERSLDIGEGDDQIRFELRDFVELGGAESADAGFLRAVRGDREEGGDADDLVPGADAAKPVRGLGGEADDALRFLHDDLSRLSAGEPDGRFG